VGEDFYFPFIHLLVIPMETEIHDFAMVFICLDSSLRWNDHGNQKAMFLSLKALTINAYYARIRLLYGSVKSGIVV